MNRLTVNHLQEICEKRSMEWQQDKPTDEDWLEFAAIELGDEAGEALGWVKKYLRFKRGMPGGINRETAVKLIGEEIADTIISAVRLAQALDIEVDDAIIGKFNATSEKHGFETYLQPAYDDDRLRFYRVEFCMANVPAIHSTPPRDPLLLAWVNNGPDSVGLTKNLVALVLARSEQHARDIVNTWFGPIRAVAAHAELRPLDRDGCAAWETQRINAALSYRKQKPVLEIKLDNRQITEGFERAREAINKMSIEVTPGTPPKSVVVDPADGPVIGPFGTRWPFDKRWPWFGTTVGACAGMFPESRPDDLLTEAPEREQVKPDVRFVDHDHDGETPVAVFYVPDTAPDSELKAKPSHTCAELHDFYNDRGCGCPVGVCPSFSVLFAVKEVMRFPRATNTMRNLVAIQPVELHGRSPGGELLKAHFRALVTHVADADDAKKIVQSELSESGRIEVLSVSRCLLSDYVGQLTVSGDPVINIKGPQIECTAEMGSPFEDIPPGRVEYLDCPEAPLPNEFDRRLRIAAAVELENLPQESEGDALAEHLAPLFNPVRDLGQLGANAINGLIKFFTK